MDLWLGKVLAFLLTFGSLAYGSDYYLSNTGIKPLTLGRKAAVNKLIEKTDLPTKWHSYGSSPISH